MQQGNVGARVPTGTMQANLSLAATTVGVWLQSIAGLAAGKEAILSGGGMTTAGATMTGAAGPPHDGWILLAVMTAIGTVIDTGDQMSGTHRVGGRCPLNAGGYVGQIFTSSLIWLKL